jgi:enoyl-CoA hydratase/carnithine racemase
MTDILTHTDGGVMTVTLNRVEKKNSITAAMYGAMADALAGCSRATPPSGWWCCRAMRPSSRAGNDIGDFLNKPPDGQDSPVFRFLRGIAAFQQAAWSPPSAARRSAWAPRCCSIATWSTPATTRRSRMPFVNLGLCPEAASSLLVPQMLGYHRAAEALLLGEPFMAEARSRWGWSTASCRPPRPTALAQAAGAQAGAKPMSSLIETKRLMKKARPRSWSSKWTMRAPASGACCASPPQRKRSRPSWSGASLISASFR